jgi:hypothetical protein
MNYLKSPLFLVSILIVAVGAVFILAWLSIAKSISYLDLKTALETTTATFGTLLGIITAGLMFTQGRFSELASELSEKSPHYLSEVLSLEKMQSIETHLRSIEKTFTQLAETSTIAHERNLYQRVSRKASLTFVNFAVLLNLKLRQQGLPETGLVLSEMDSNLHKAYQKRRRNIKKDWQILDLIKQIIGTWEAPSAFFIEKSDIELGLEAELKSSLAVLKLKRNVDKSLEEIYHATLKVLSDLDKDITRISKRLHEDRIFQLLPQMQQAIALRSKYFFLALFFIAAPLLINLIIMLQLSETTASLFQPVISITSFLSVLGVIFLLLYIYKILEV